MNTILHKVRNIDKSLVHIKEGESFYIGVEMTPFVKEKLLTMGFSENLEVGEQVLPSGNGKVTTYNARGSIMQLKFLPKETVYREQYRTWVFNKKEYSGWISIPYKRYQRKQIKPPSQELLICDVEHRKLVISQQLKNNADGQKTIKHIIHLFVELFGGCEILKEDLKSSIPPTTKIKKLNWTFLPKGEYPFSKIKEDIISTINHRSTEYKKRIEDRLGVINDMLPDFIAIGKGGFNGYLIFGFEEQSIYILESLNIDNATYILESDDWESISKLSKAEILHNNYEKERIIHTKNWKNKVKNTLK